MTRLDSVEADGRFRLTAFEHMLGIREWLLQEVDETLDGDFWLHMRPSFYGQRTYVPFLDGVVVEDPVQWVAEEPYKVRMDRLREARRAANSKTVTEPPKS